MGERETERERESEREREYKKRERERESMGERKEGQTPGSRPPEHTVKIILCFQKSGAGTGQNRLSPMDSDKKSSGVQSVS